MKAINIIVTICLLSFVTFVPPAILARQTITMHNFDVEPTYQKPTIVLYGDDSDENNSLPLKKLAVIAKPDMELLWSDLGIDTSVWPPVASLRAHRTNFPMLYASQGYIAFEREYRSEELNMLIAECKRARTVVVTEGARRALKIILKAANLENNHQGKLLFRPGMYSPNAERE